MVRNRLGSVGDLFDALEGEKDFGKVEGALGLLGDLAQSGARMTTGIGREVSFW